MYRSSSQPWQRSRRCKLHSSELRSPINPTSNRLSCRCSRKAQVDFSIKSRSRAVCSVATIVVPCRRRCPCPRHPQAAICSVAEPRPAVACLASRLNRLHHRVAVATSLEDSQHRVDFSAQPSQPPATSSLHRPQASLSLAMRAPTCSVVALPRTTRQSAAGTMATACITTRRKRLRPCSSASSRKVATRSRSSARSPSTSSRRSIRRTRRRSRTAATVASASSAPS